MTNWHHFSGIFDKSKNPIADSLKLFVNGAIYIDSTTRVKNLLIENNLVKDSNVNQDDYQDISVIDLQGKTIFPGFMDSHCHLLESGFVLKAGVNLEGIRNSTQEIADKIKERVEKSEANDIILAVGFWMDDYSKWCLDDLAIIDAVSPNNPVMAVDMTGHNLVVNSAAMKLCNIDTESTKDCDTNLIGKENGKLTGMFKEKCMQKPADCIFSKFEHADLVKEGTKQFLDLWASKGYTSIVDLMGAPGFRLDKPDVFRELEKDGQLSVRVSYCYTLFDVDGVEHAATLKGEDTELVKFYGGKIFIDGAFAGGEAWTSWEHTDKTFGSPQVSPEELNKIVKRAEELRLNMHYHTQGDRAIQAVLDALDETKKALGAIKQTHVLAHVAFMTAEQMTTIAGYNGKVVVTVQPVFCETEDDLSQYYKGHLNEVYQIKQMFDAGLSVGMSTDFSVSPLNMTSPSVVMSVAMDGAGKPDVYWPLTAEEVVRGFSEYNAKVAAVSDIGSLHNGKKADFVIYEGNFYTACSKSLKENSPRVFETWINGKKRFA